MADGAAQTTETHSQLRVLLVDDDPDMRSLLEIMLAKDGRFCVMGHASDGAEAVRLAVSEQPDIVVLDLQMPGMDGLTALPLLRERLPAARIVVVSAFPDPLTLADAMQRGVDGYIDKSRTWCELVPTLEGLCALV
ncbi:MAG: response regulator transcription factor [Acidimicrobiales bacterium]